MTAGANKGDEAPDRQRRPVRIKRPSEKRSVSRSAIRALDVLELFGQLRAALRAGEIAQVLGLHPSTADQLLKTMVDAGHLTFEARSKTYLPGHRLARFAAWIVEGYGSDDRLRRLLEDVHAASGAVVTLTTANDTFMQIVDQVGTNPDGRPPERGLQISLFGSAVGGAYLSLLSDVEIRRLAGRARLSELDTAEAIAAAAQVRRDGVAESEASDGSLWSIAAALPRAAYPVPLVLGLAGTPAQVQGAREQLRDLLRAAADRRQSSIGPGQDTVDEAGDGGEGLS